MSDKKERRPSKKNSIKENKKYPYKNKRKIILVDGKEKCGMACYAIKISNYVDK